MVRIVSPRKPRNAGEPHGPGSLTSSLHPKEEEREREREREIDSVRGTPETFHSLTQWVGGRANGLRVSVLTPKPCRKKERAGATSAHSPGERKIGARFCLQVVLVHPGTDCTLRPPVPPFDPKFTLWSSSYSFQPRRGTESPFRNLITVSLCCFAYVCHTTLSVTLHQVALWSLHFEPCPTTTVGAAAARRLGGNP